VGGLRSDWWSKGTSSKRGGAVFRGKGRCGQEGTPRRTLEESGTPCGGTYLKSSVPYQESVADGGGKGGEIVCTKRIGIPKALTVAPRRGKRKKCCS